MGVEEQKKKRKRILKIVGALIVLLVAILWGMTMIPSPPSPTAPFSLGCNLEDYKVAVQPLLEEWDDAVTLANQTSRMSLSTPVSSLQQIKRRTAKLEVDGCFIYAHSFLIKYMEYTIDGFLAFMSQESDSTVQANFRLAKTNFEIYIVRLTD